MCRISFQIRMFILTYGMVVFAFSCDSSRLNREKPITDADSTSALVKIFGKHRQVAKNRYPEGVDYVYNTSKTHILCIKRIQAKEPHHLLPLTFFIFDILEDEILYEDTVVGGEVIWLNDYQIRVSRTPGIVRGDETTDRQTSSYIYDVIKKQKKNRIHQ